MQKIIRAGLTVLFTAVTLTAATDKQDEPLAIVHATEPTVITVHGKAEQVNTKPHERRGAGKLKRAPVAAARCAGRFTGWLLNESDTILRPVSVQSCGLPGYGNRVRPAG